ncbi:hypothetical protein ITJ38_04180 [Agreia pratensis]|nr:hypothetical protein [Agreia pratensis]MBF4633599.1 hypothetical protein [Agreia pratensis]
MIRRRDGADLLASCHVIALLQRGLERLVARYEVTGVRDRKHGTIHHVPGEVHGSRLGRDHDVACRRFDVDTSMTGGVRIDGLLPLADHDVRLAHGPCPVRQCGNLRRHGETRRDKKRHEVNGEPTDREVDTGTMHRGQPVKGDARDRQDAPNGGEFVPRSKC